MGVNVAFASYHLAGRSLSSDEGTSWLVASEHGAVLWHSLAVQGGEMFLYYLVLHGVIGLFGPSVLVLRMPSVIAGTLAIPVVYQLGRHVARSRLVGVEAACLFAVSQPIIFWQQDARAYSLDALFGAVTTLCIYLAATRNDGRWYAAWVIASVAAYLTHPLSVLMIASQLVALPLLRWSRPALRHLLWSGVALAVAGIPLGYLAAGRGLAGLGWLTRPSWNSLEEVAQFFASAAPSPERALAWVALVLALVAWITTLAATIRLVARQGRGEVSFGMTLILATLVGAPVAAFVASEVVQPVFVDHYLIMALPSAAVAIALALQRLRRELLGVLGCGLLLAVHAAIVVSGYGVILGNDLAATRYVVAHSNPRDCIMFYDESQRTLYDYYTRNVPSSRLPRQVLPDQPDHPSADLIQAVLNRSKTVDLYTNTAALNAVARRCPVLWLYIAHAGGRHRGPLQLKAYEGLLGLTRSLSVHYDPAGVHEFDRTTVELWLRP